MTTREDGIPSASYLLYEPGSIRQVENAVVGERQVCIFLNGQELVTLRCSPYDLDELAIGFLRSEGLIGSFADINVLTVSATSSCVDVWLKDVSIKPPARRIITSGCGEGVTFEGLRVSQALIETGLSIEAAQVNALMNKLMQVAEVHREVGGVHTSALSDGQNLILAAEDMGLNNTIDRLWGKALRQGIETKDHILLCSGRIVSDITEKAIEMALPIIISLTSPTSLSIEMAMKANITIIGYARGNTFRIYSISERVNTTREKIVPP